MGGLSDDNMNLSAIMDLNTTMSPGNDVMDHLAEGMKKMTEKATLVDELNFIMMGIVAPIFCFIGMVGNVLAIITWNRPNMRSSTGRYLSGQAVADFAVLLFYLTIFSAQTWTPGVIYSPVYGFLYCYVFFPGLFFAVVCSVWYTVGVTIDRYILVCWITKAKQYCNVKRANFGLALITFNSFIINFPHYLSFTTVDQSSIINNNNDNSSSNASEAAMATPTKVKTFKETEFYTGPSGQFYEFWIHCMILIIIPWVTVFSMNIMIIRAIHKSNKKNAEKKTTSSVRRCKQSENQITRQLLIVTFTFLFFIGLQCVIQCMFMKKPAGFNMFIVNSSFAIAGCGIVFNSSLNFFLYCLTGRRFRTELLRVLCLYKKDQKQFSSLVDRPSGSSSRQTTSSTRSTGI